MTQRIVERLNVFALYVLTLAAILISLSAHAAQLPAFLAPALTVLPDDGLKPIIQIIDNASRSIDITTPNIESDAVRAALASASKRGIRVRALFTRHAKGRAEAVKDFQAQLTAAGIFTRWASASSRSDEQYFIVVDKKAAYVSTLALTAQNLKTSRGFIARILDPRDVKELGHLFESHWSGKTISPRSARLAWSTTQYRQVLSTMIADATQSLSIYAEHVKDEDAIRLLERAVQRGVRIRALLAKDDGHERAWATRLSLKGVEVKVLAKPKLRATVIIADAGSKAGRALIGSNGITTPTSLPPQGLAVITENAKLIERLERIFVSDFARARK